MKVIVTGGLGFIGSNFICHIHDAHPDWHILNIDKRTYAGNPANVAAVKNSPRYSWLKADIANRNKMHEALKGADAVVHFAAETHVDRSILDPEVFMRTNVLGTQSLLDAAKAHKIPKFVFVGTDEVYGSVPTGESVETDPLQPNSPYSVSKAASDMLARAYFITFGLPVCITRCSNNYGPRQHPEKAIPLLITNALEDKPFPLYGDGKNVRDWLYVLDHAKALETVLLKGKPGEIYNIGGGTSLANVDLIERVLKVMGKPLSLIQRVPDRAGHDKRYALSCEKLMRELGWKPEHDFEAGIRETVQWYIDNRAWWKKAKQSAEFRRYHQKQYAERGAAQK